jgi:hypothetical protein
LIFLAAGSGELLRASGWRAFSLEIDSMVKRSMGEVVLFLDGLCFPKTVFTQQPKTATAIATAEMK